MQVTQKAVASNPSVREWQKPFRSVAVLGAGTMGSQIAAHCANVGLEVTLLDIAPKDGTDKNAIVKKAFKSMSRMSPAPFADKTASGRIRLGNFDDNFEWIADADWIIEVVVERIDIKRQVMAKIEQYAGSDAVISSNTSGLPIASIAEGRSESFRRRFLGTHFFNPPRYLQLLEVIPTPDTDPDVLARICYFGRIHLGKGIVVAKDRPYFIGNRIGMYGMMSAVSEFSSGAYSIEEVDALTGPLTGRPRSATFRTADVVGLDVMKHVIENLREAVPDDESVSAFTTPELLRRLVDNGALGAKTKAGFYQKDGKEIKSISRETGLYESAKAINLPGIDEVKKLKTLPERLRALFVQEGRAGEFFRKTTLDLLGYAARRIPEVSDSPLDVDNAIQWGFGWEMGPFAIWDTLGFEVVLDALRERDISVPNWVDAMSTNGISGFYKSEHDGAAVYVPSKSAFETIERPADKLKLTSVKSKADSTLWENSDAGLLDLGDGVALFEFRSKANSLGQELIEGLIASIDRIENDSNFRGMVIGNDGTNFTVGANLGEAAMGVAMGQFDTIEKAVARFQQAVQRVRYSAKPVVVATHQRVLGGGCELALACTNTVAAFESYIGLVELGVGLIPAGTGTTRLAAYASDRAANGHDSEILATLQKVFETVAMATVAGSAVEAKSLGLLPASAQVVMNNDRRLFVAKQRVQWLSAAGYMPPPVSNRIKVLGGGGRATLTAGVYQFLAGKFISEYDFFLATEFARVLTGGDITGAQEVHEDYLIELERETFVRLLAEPKTQARITNILTTNKPLRN